MTFEENAEAIIKEIEKRRGKWRLESIKHLDFDDVKQEIFIHIWSKWEQYDPEKPLLNWVNRVITHQMINKIRNHYGIFARPCISCDMNQGGDSCSYTKSKVQCSECPLYREWEKKKKSAYEIALAKELDYHPSEYSYDQDDEIDYIGFLERNELKIKEEINPTAHKIYRYIFIEGHTEEEAAIHMGFKVGANNKTHKQISNYIKKIREILKRGLEEEEYRFLK